MTLILEVELQDHESIEFLFNLEMFDERLNVGLSIEN